MPPALAKLPLVLLVALCATAELVLNRIGVHLINSPAARRSALFRVVDVGGLYSFYLAGLLALITLTWAVVVQIRDTRILRPPDRIAFTLLSALFLPLAAMGLLFNLPHQVAPHLNTAFGLMLIVVVVGFLRQRAPLRAKLGVLYLTAPLLLHCYWLMTQQLPGLAPSGANSELPGQLFVTAEHLVVVGAFAAFLFFAPFPRLSNLLHPVPLVAAVLVTSATALLARYHYLEATQAAYHGFGINLPPPSAHGLVHLAALFVFVVTLVSLTMRGGRQQSVALGLYLVAVSGFHLQLPYQLMLTLLGMMQICRASLDEEELLAGSGARAQQQFPAMEQWRAYLQRLVDTCVGEGQGGEVVLLHNGGQQVAHLRGQRDGQAFTLRLVQEGPRLARLDLTLGKQPKEPPPIALTRRSGLRGRKVSQRSSGPKTRLHAEALDSAFEIHYGANLPTDVLREHAPEIAQRIHGWLALWPGEGVHYTSLPPEDGWPIPLAEVQFSQQDASVEEVVELVALLAAIARRAGVS